MFFPVSVFANENNYVGCDLIGVEESKFENLIEEIQNIETTHPEYTEEMIKNVLDERHQSWIVIHGYDFSAVHINNSIRQLFKVCVMCYHD